MALTQAEAQELEQLEAEFGGKTQPMAKPVGLTEAEAQELAQLEAEFGGQQTPMQSTQSRPVEAFVQNVGQAASFGYLPQIQAAVGPYIQKGADFLFGDDTNKQLAAQGFKIQEAPQKEYVQRRDEAASRLEQLTAENPKASLLGTGVGAISGGIGLGGLFGAGAKTATGLQRVGQAAKGGALIGAIRNPGDVEGELNPSQLKERAVNVLKDAATGAVLQGGFEAVGGIAKILKNAPDNLKNYSQIKAVKAGGAMLKDFRKQLGNKKANELGQAIIDNGIISVGDDINAIAQKAEGLKQLTANNLDEIYTQADDIINKAMQAGDESIKNSIAGSEINLTKFSQDYKQNLANKYKGMAGSKTVINRLSDELDNIAESGVVNLSKLREVRGTVDDLIDFSKANRELKPVQQEFLKLRSEINDLAKSRIALADKLTGSKLLPKLINENKNYSNFATVSKMAKDKSARESSNAVFGLRERISSGAGGVVGSAIGAGIGGPVGAGVGSIIGAGLGAISTKVARNYGTPFVAITANKIAKALSKNQGALDKFSDPLIKAAQNSPKDFVNAVNLFMSKPEFKRKIRNLK